MRNFFSRSSLLTKLSYPFMPLYTTLSYSFCSFQALFSSFISMIVFRLNSFCIELCYFVILSAFGFLAMTVSSKAKSSSSPTSFDLFFTSVSAATVSSMTTVEMEAFSQTQLVIMCVLMLMGGEVFTSMLELQLLKFKYKFTEVENSGNKVDSVTTGSDSSQTDLHNPHTDLEFGNKQLGSEDLRYNSVRVLSYVVLGYLLLVLIGGSSLVSIYLSLVPSANNLLQTKGLNLRIFSIFTTISTFSNCGFLPNNENMMAFSKNSGLLLILIPLILMGNTLYPVFLQLVIRVLKRLRNDKPEFGYMLKNYGELGYIHLFSGLHSCYLAITAFVFILIQLTLFLSLEWKTEVLNVLSSFEKVIASLFQVVNSRHSGENVFDLSLITPAILTMFVGMMYLPSYTYFLPVEDHENLSRQSRIKRKKITPADVLLLSPLPFLVILIIIICITENQKLQQDPLNFSVFSIVFEVISAYGNVGFSLGYSCKRRLNAQGNCEDKWTGFVGRWSNSGKLVLILIMIYGRLRKFYKRGRGAWKLS